jgi:hypothetical protein
MNAQRWFGRHAGEALGSATQEVAVQVRQAGLAVRVVGVAGEPPIRRRRCITLTETAEGTVAAVEVR